MDSRDALGASLAVAVVQTLENALGEEEELARTDAVTVPDLVRICITECCGSELALGQDDTEGLPSTEGVLE